MLGANTRRCSRTSGDHLHQGEYRTALGEYNEPQDIHGAGINEQGPFVASMMTGLNKATQLSQKFFMRQYATF